MAFNSAVSPRGVSRLNILVVDDEVMVQQVCQGMLKALDHVSIGVSNAIDAVERLTERPQKFDLVILDNGLPGLSGIELYAILREWNMPIPVILISGRIHQPDSSELVNGTTGFQFLAKPFTIAELQTVIDQSQT